MARTCSRCGSYGPFYRDKQNKDGLSTWCKLCKDESKKKWQNNNPDKTRQYAAKWRERYPERYKETDRQWRQNNRGKYNAKNYRRRTNQKNNGGNHTTAEWKALCKQYDYRCLACGKKKPLTVDHIIPIVRGGSNNIINIQPLCKSCNSSKRDKCIDYRTKSGILRWIQEKLF